MGWYGNGSGARLGPDEAEEIAAALTEHELERGRLETICVRWVADEARTLSEAVDRLRDFAEWPAELETEGWQLVEPVDGGHGHLVNRDPRARVEDEAVDYRAEREAGSAARFCGRCSISTESPGFSPANAGRR